MKISRRELLGSIAAVPALAATSKDVVEVPVLLMTNKHASFTPAALNEFRAKVWQEAVNCLAESGVVLKIEERSGEVLKYPGGRPRFIGLDPSSLNVIINDHIPLSWDQARHSGGVARIYEGCHLCLLSVRAAHGNRVPFIALNSAVHELLHVLLQDIFAKRSETFQGYDREVRVDWHATRIWLFRDGSGVRSAAQEYLKRLRPS